jgi:hypothetical protein
MEKEELINEIVKGELENLSILQQLQKNGADVLESIEHSKREIKFYMEYLKK